MKDPPDGQPLIAPGEEPRFDALMNWSVDKWHTYIIGFRDAARHLVAAATTPAGLAVDFAIFPIAFLYRHVIELQLKHLIISTRRVLESPPQFTPTHDLKRLWDDAKTLLNEAGYDTNDEVFNRASSLIDQFRSVDPSGQSFRYPVDSSGNATLDGIDRVNVRVFGERVEEIVELLEGLGEVVYAWLDGIAEQRAAGRDAAGY